jgi:biopolymer transport protein ExbB
MLPDSILPEWFTQLGAMGWPLALCSFAALAICFERAMFSVKSQRNQDQHYQKLADYLTAHKAQPKSTRDEMVTIMLSELRQPYLRGIKGLHLIGIISPMLGLLGTILGIIAAFKVISVQAGPVSPSMIADGLWEAMLTTAVGLAIALPAILMGHFFTHLSETQLSSFCLRLNKLSMAFELEKNAKEPALVAPNFEKLAA